MKINEIKTGDELVAGSYYTLYRNEQGLKNGGTYLATKNNGDYAEGEGTQVVNVNTGGTFVALRSDIFTA